MRTQNISSIPLLSRCYAHVELQTPSDAALVVDAARRGGLVFRGRSLSAGPDQNPPPDGVSVPIGTGAPVSGQQRPAPAVGTVGGVGVVTGGIGLPAPPVQGGRGGGIPHQQQYGQPQHVPGTGNGMQGQGGQYGQYGPGAGPSGVPQGSPGMMQRGGGDNMPHHPQYGRGGIGSGMRGGGGRGGRGRGGGGGRGGNRRDRPY